MSNTQEYMQSGTLTLQQAAYGNTVARSRRQWKLLLPPEVKLYQFLAS